MSPCPLLQTHSCLSCDKTHSAPLNLSRFPNASHPQPSGWSLLLPGHLLTSSTCSSGISPSGKPCGTPWCVSSPTMHSLTAPGLPSNTASQQVALLHVAQGPGSVHPPPRPQSPLLPAGRGRDSGRNFQVVSLQARVLHVLPKMKCGYVVRPPSFWLERGRREA